MAEQENQENPAGEVFDARAQKEAKRAQKALRNANLKAVFGTGLGRISLFVVGGAIVLLMLLGGYQFFGGRAAAPVKPVATANDAILTGGGVSADASVASDAEAEMRKNLYKQQAAAAKQEKQPYMAPPIMNEGPQGGEGPVGAGGLGSPTMPGKGGSIDGSGTLKTTGPTAQPPGTGGQNQNQNVSNKQLDSDMATLRSMMEKIRKEDVMPQMMVALGKDDGAATGGGGRRQGFSTGAYGVVQTAMPSATPAPSQKGVDAGTSTSPASKTTASTGKCTNPIIHAGEACYGQIQSAINTDNPGKEVVASVYQCKGVPKATALGKIEETEQDVGVTFDKLSIPGHLALSIQARGYADDAEGSSGLADDVDNHYFQRFVGTGLAAIATGLGRAAAMTQGTVQTTGYAGSSSTVSTQDPISASRQAKMALGEVGTTVGSEIKKSNDKLKPTKKTNAKKDIKIVFLSDVCEEK